MLSEKMPFEKLIIHLIETTEMAWNEAQFDKFNDILEDDVYFTMKEVTLGGFKFKEQKMKGKENAIEFIRNYRHVLPLKYAIEIGEEKFTKYMVYYKYFYEINARAKFNCVISEYGKYKEFHILDYSYDKTGKINLIQVIVNIIKFKINRLTHKYKFI